MHLRISIASVMSVVLSVAAARLAGAMHQSLE
jgi:hypothetical protein